MLLVHLAIQEDLVYLFQSNYFALNAGSRTVMHNAPGHYEARRRIDGSVVICMKVSSTCLGIAVLNRVSLFVLTTLFETGMEHLQGSFRPKLCCVLYLNRFLSSFQNDMFWLIGLFVLLCACLFCSFY